MYEKFFSLEGKTALITGASGGIGGAIARAMYYAGANVVINGRNADKLNLIKEELEAKSPDDAAQNRIYTVPLSLMDIDAPARLVKQASEMAEHHIDILVNAAGIHGFKQFPKTTKDMFHNFMEVNYVIPAQLCQNVIKPMVENKYGRIINITSAATHGAAGQAAYNSSKAALEGLTKSLASNSNFVQHGVTINAIAPGIIDTDMMRALRGEAKQRNLIMIPMGRFGHAHEVAGAAVFLASEAASYINAIVLPVDGGMVR